MDKEVVLRIHSSKKKYLLLIAFLTLMIFGLKISIINPKFFAAQQFENGSKKSKKSVSAKIPVAVEAAVQGDFPIYLTGLGTVTPLRTVTVRSRVDGELVRVAFKEGQNVQEGDVLAEIDPRPFKARLMQVEGQLLHDEALLKNAEIDLARYRTLLAQDSIAAQQVVTQEALVQQYRGTVETDRGQIADAKLQLDYARIVSPIAGRAGLRLIDKGNIVHVSDNTGLVVITQIHPITVVYTLAEDDLSVVMKRLRSGAKVLLEAYNRSGEVKLAEGKLLAVDNQIDTATGTVKLKGLFDNSDQSLFPNQFVNIKMLVEMLHAVTLVPSSAIQTGISGPYVYVVNDDRTVSVRKLKLGPLEGKNVQVLEGLKPKELVVVDGVDRLHEGAKVELVVNHNIQSKDSAFYRSFPQSGKKKIMPENG